MLQIVFIRPQYIVVVYCITPDGKNVCVYVHIFLYPLYSLQFSTDLFYFWYVGSGHGKEGPYCFLWRSDNFCTRYSKFKKTLFLTSFSLWSVFYRKCPRLMAMRWNFITCKLVILQHGKNTLIIVWISLGMTIICRPFTVQVMK